METIIDWNPTKEQLESVKDAKEIETGVFHWRDKKGDYIPVTNMSIEELQHAKEVCDTRLGELDEKLNKRLKQITKELDKLNRTMLAWAHRSDHIEETLYLLTDGVSKEAIEGTKEITE